MNIAILTSKESWFVPYVCEFVRELKGKGHSVILFHKSEDVGTVAIDFEIVFMLSYFHRVEFPFLKDHKHNLVIHVSDLPLGKGWAPLFWQILEGKNKIPIVLFEANIGIDAGDIYLKDYIVLEGHELNDEIRRLQAEKTIEMCLRFLDENPENIPQEGEESVYRKRISKDSQLDVNKSIVEQFNLLRIVNNEEFPAFFNYKGHKYILKIFKEEK